MLDNIIFGKNPTEKIISLEIIDEEVVYLTADNKEGSLPFYYWLLTPHKYTNDFVKLKGNLHYKYMAKTQNKEKFKELTKVLRERKCDFYTIWNEKESAMVYYGLTMFKGLKFEELSVLSFDIESTGLVKDDDSKVFVITSTFKDRLGKLETVQFRLDKYENQVDMINDWCEFVYNKDPDVLTGHNINGYDIPFLQHCYGAKGLPLGRDGSGLFYKSKPSEKRVDGSQSWTYHKVMCFGREIVDGMFLAVMYDIGRNYPSWGLKAIAKYEGWVTDDRQFYDGALIGKNWYIPEEREKIIKYCEDDGLDSLRVYELMAPSVFYMTQSIPKPFQLVTESASGSWLNTLLIRSYLQDGHSIPKKNEPSKVSGGISFGIPGLYKNVFKIDIKSMYPSIIRSFNLYPFNKDPNKHYLMLANYFTEKRFEYKRLHKETNDKYYDDRQASMKIFINSMYGLLGANGLNFNDFSVADKITGLARQIIRKTIIWASGSDITHWWKEYEADKDNTYRDILQTFIKKNTYRIVSGDTDSICFNNYDDSEINIDEQKRLLKEINSLLPKMIEYEDDGYFSHALIIKAKNYVLVKDGKIKKKGSSLIDSKKAPILSELLDECISDLLFHNGHNLKVIYDKYVKEAKEIKDITKWCVKASITKAVLKPERLNEQKVLDALKGREFKEGDKVYLFNYIDGEIQDSAKGELKFDRHGNPKMIPNRVLRHIDDFDGSYDVEHYVKRIRSTINILATVVDMNRFINYTLKVNLKKLEEL